MNVYVFSAAIWCEVCAAKYMADNVKPAHVNMECESSYDSDEWPKGPYGDGGGEADCPQHCADCGAFLCNPLTGDGVQYVREALAENTGDSAVLAEWREFYSDYGVAE